MLFLPCNRDHTLRQQKQYHNQRSLVTQYNHQLRGMKKQLSYEVCWSFLFINSQCRPNPSCKTQRALPKPSQTSLAAEA